MIEWATNKKVQSDSYKRIMSEIQEKYIHIIGAENLTDYKEFELPFIVEAIKKYVEPNGKCNVLDFGTGISPLPAYLDSLGVSVCCLDLDEGAWHPEVGESEYNGTYQSNVRYARADILQSPEIYPDNFFDVVYSASTLEHVPAEQIVPIIKALDKKVKKGGIQLHLVDFDEARHPIDFKKLTEAMESEGIGEEPDDVYNPSPHISRIAIWKNTQ